MFPRWLLNWKALEYSSIYESTSGKRTKDIYGMGRAPTIAKAHPRPTHQKERRTLGSFASKWPWMLMYCPTFGQTPPSCLRPRAPRKLGLGPCNWVKLACSGVAGTTLLITVNCQNRLKSGGHGFKLYRSRRCSLHHCIRQKAARKNVDGLPTMPCMVSLYTASYMASLSLSKLFGLSFARTGKNDDLIARASRKNICSNCRESPLWPPKQMASRQALLGKDIHRYSFWTLSQACMFRSCWHHLKNKTWCSCGSSAHSQFPCKIL